MPDLFFAWIVGLSLLGFVCLAVGLIYLIVAGLYYAVANRIER